MSHLRSLSFRPSPAAFTRMLQPPHPMQIESLIVQSTFTVEFGASIVHLPSLTDLFCPFSSEHTDFFRQLPNLRRLELRTTKGTGSVVLDTDRIMSSLHALTKLTDLRMGAFFLSSGEDPDSRVQLTAANLAACLPHMPLLTRLELSSATSLDSLRFLSCGPILPSLQRLELRDFARRLPLSELVHVHALSSLTSLTLEDVFDAPLDEETKALFMPPSALLPRLRHFVHKWKPLA
jgi:hypothetical protein